MIDKIVLENEIRKNCNIVIEELKKQLADAIQYTEYMYRDIKNYELKILSLKSVIAELESMQYENQS